MKNKKKFLTRRSEKPIYQLRKSKNVSLKKLSDTRMTVKNEAYVSFYKDWSEVILILIKTAMKYVVYGVKPKDYF